MLNKQAALLALPLFAVLAACDEAPQQPSGQLGGAQQQIADAAPPVDSSEPDPSMVDLLEALKNKAKKGSRLVPTPENIEIVLNEGAAERTATRLVNQGDTDILISQITLTSKTAAAVIDTAGCFDGTLLPPGDSCDLILTYEDTTGRDLDTSILVTSDALNGQFTIGLGVTVNHPEPDPEPAPEPQAGSEPTSEPQQPQQPQVIPAPQPQAPAPQARPRITAEMIARANARRRASGFGRLQRPAEQVSGKPQVRSVNYDDRYPEEAFAWTEASLPVNRENILTADRVVPAFLEQTFNNVMCNQVVAVTRQDVYSPDSSKILLPVGTRFIGECAEFTDERAMVVWTRFITPNGVSARITGMTADAMGRGGIPGHLDRRFFDRYGLPLLFTAINTVTQAILGDDTTTTTNLESGNSTTNETATGKAVDNLSGATQDTITRIGSELRQVKQVLTIPAGSTIEITLTEDIYFKTNREVVSLGDYEYELRRERGLPVIDAPVAPGYQIEDRNGSGSADLPAGTQSIVINGQAYNLVPNGQTPARARSHLQFNQPANDTPGDAYQAAPEIRNPRPQPGVVYEAPTNYEAQSTRNAQGPALQQENYATGNATNADQRAYPLPPGQQGANQ